MLKIKPYQPSDQDEVIKLVLHCQNDGSRPIISLDNQPDLLTLYEKYILPGGGFWVAKDDGKLAGCIGLTNAGHGIGILKKFFVYEAYRGEPHHLGKKLYDELLAFACQHGFRQLILDTPKNTERAHKFYIKAGFELIAQEDMPVQYDYPYADSDFFRLKLL